MTDMFLATALPEQHLVLLDPRKIVADSASAAPLLRQLHARLPQTFLAAYRRGGEHHATPQAASAVALVPQA